MENGQPVKAGADGGERLMSGPENSDGKPCSGVRGDHSVSTDLPGGTQRILRNHSVEKTLFPRFLYFKKGVGYSCKKHL